MVTWQSHVQCGVFLTLRMTSGSARWNLSARLPSSVNFTVYLRRPPYELICSITQTLPTVKQCCTLQAHLRTVNKSSIPYLRTVNKSSIPYLRTVNKSSIPYLRTVNKSSIHNNKIVHFRLVSDVGPLLTFFYITLQNQYSLSPNG